MSERVLVPSAESGNIGEGGPTESENASEHHEGCGAWEKYEQLRGEQGVQDGACGGAANMYMKARTGVLKAGVTRQYACMATK